MRRIESFSKSHTDSSAYFLKRFEKCIQNSKLLRVSRANTKGYLYLHEKHQHGKLVT